MALVLLTIIVFNSAVVGYLWIAGKKSEALHLKKIQLLESIIAELLKSVETNHEKVRLADELKEEIRFAKNKLNADILSLYYELLEVVRRNKLIE